MTHSLHREGPSLEKDFVWLMYQTKGINDDNIRQKAEAFLEVVEEVGSKNWGDVKTGPLVSFSREEIIENLTEKSRLRGIFTSKNKVTEFLKKIKEKDIGLSVIISGPLEETFEACEKSDLEPHTVNYSLGIFGNKERLADKKTLAITTMCGHHLIPDGVVENLRESVREGRYSPEKAALKLAKLCPCGIFNQDRATKLLTTEKQAKK